MKIVTRNLGKRFNREWIFKNFDFTFEPGNCYAIVGPNGSGKSTLIQILWGQVPASVGSINFFHQEKEVAAEDAYRNTSIATPYMDLIDEFTLDEMVNFHFKFKSPTNHSSQNELVDLMELSHARSKRISNFSSGMRQRLKLGLAFFTNTSSIFLDEPTTNLDKQAIEWYQVNLRKMDKNRLIIIASNAAHEYPDNAIKVDLTDLK